MKQFTKEQAIAIAVSGDWKKLDQYSLAYLQLHQNCLFCNFGAFQEAIGYCLDRPVFTHEFDDPEWLKEELKFITWTKPVYTPLINEFLEE